MTDSTVLDAWHRIVESKDPRGLDALIADDAVFHSPAVHSPQEGKALTVGYLTAAVNVLGPTLTYHRTWEGPRSVVLEFKATLDGREIHGCDFISWNADGQIDEFMVMVRPFRGLQAVIEHMSAELQRLAGS